MQRERNKKRQNIAGPKIVKTDALSLHRLIDKAFIAFKVKNGKIVKTDTLLLQRQAFVEMEAISALNSS